MHVYRKGGPEMKAMHYGNNDRIAPIVLEAKIGFVITHSDQPERKRGKLLLQKALGVEATKCQCWIIVIDVELTLKLLLSRHATSIKRNKR